MDSKCLCSVQSRSSSTCGCGHITPDCNLLVITGVLKLRSGTLWHLITIFIVRINQTKPNKIKSLSSQTILTSLPQYCYNCYNCFLHSNLLWVKNNLFFTHFYQPTEKGPIAQTKTLLLTKKETDLLIYFASSFVVNYVSEATVGGKLMCFNGLRETCWSIYMSQLIFLSVSEKDWDKFAATFFNLYHDIQENRIQVYNS